MILLHYGITHKVALKFVEKALSEGKGIQHVSDMSADAGAATPIVIKRSFSSSIVATSAFKCPMCTLTLSHSSRSDHLSKHFYESLSADLPLSAPFSCPKTNCRFIAIDRMSLIRHYGDYHNMSDKLLKEHLSRMGADCSTIIVRDRCGDIVSKSGVECRLCERDSAPFLKNSADLYRHLSETHFSQRLLKELDDVPSDVKPFKCNQPGCDFSCLARSILLVHLGIFHRCAVKYYSEVLAVSDAITSPSGQQQQRPCSVQAAAPVKTAPVKQQNQLTPPKVALSSPSVQGKSESSVVKVCPVCGLRFGPDALLVHVADKVRKLYS
jgi:hypothetical protein